MPPLGLPLSHPTPPGEPAGQSLPEGLVKVDLG